MQQANEHNGVWRMAVIAGAANTGSRVVVLQWLVEEA